MEILIPEGVATEAGQKKSFEHLATHLARLKASPRVKILPRLVLEDERTDVLANVARVRGMSQAHAGAVGCLRRAEKRAAASYSLPILSFATHLGMVADPAHTAYVQDQRNQLDLAARMSAMALIATAITCLAMWSPGTWLLTAPTPYPAARLPSK